jgi:hypothetical protein
VIKEKERQTRSCLAKKLFKKCLLFQFGFDGKTGLATPLNLADLWFFKNCPDSSLESWLTTGWLVYLAAEEGWVEDPGQQVRLRVNHHPQHCL